MSTEVRRKLTTILAADADGYSRAMETDEVGALASLQAARAVFSRFIERHHGRIANTAGDGLIAEFPSFVEAVQCAIEVQNELTSADSRLRFRIGVHLGDVLVDGDDLLGEGVNLAARLQTMADPGGILISQQVYDQVQKKLSVGFEYLGERQPKNFAESVAVYSVASAATATAGAKSLERKARPASERRARSPEDLRRRVARQAAIYGIIFAGLLALDLSTGPPMWAQWPGLALAMALGLQAAPLLSFGWLRVAYARVAVICAGLILINLFSWQGYPWAIWPVGGLILITAVGRLMAG
jgi:adenylate cyclase